MPCYTVLYTRKSTEEDDRQILSLDAQERECRTYAGRHGIAIDALIREAHSARKPGRPLFTAMLQKIEQLRRKGVPVRVLCHKPDRLLRNLGDWARINDLMDAGLTCEFVTGSYPNNAQGKMAFGINVIFAKYYVDNLSEEVKKGMRQKIERGEWPGLAPLGYRNVDRRVVLDPKTAPLIRWAFEQYATGEYSLERLTGELAGQGLCGRRFRHPITKAILHQHILCNPFHCGLLRYQGQLYPASHEPLIRVALYERVQAVLRGKAHPKRRHHAFRYSGLLQCAVCGCAVVGDLKHKGTKTYSYYRCSHRRGPCPERYLRQETLDAALAASLTRALTLPAWLTEQLCQLAEQLAQEQDPAVSRTALERRLKEQEGKLSVLLDLRLDAAITDDEYQRKRAALMVESARLREQATMFELPSPDPREAVNRFIRLCREVPQVVTQGTDEDVRHLLRIVGSNYQLGGGKVQFEPVEPFTLAAQAQTRPVWRPAPDDVRNLVTYLQSLQERLSASPESDPITPSDPPPLCAN
jgi:site-specific DNA recombinase